MRRRTGNRVPNPLLIIAGGAIIFFMGLSMIPLLSRNAHSKGMSPGVTSSTAGEPNLVKVDQPQQQQQQQQQQHQEQQQQQQQQPPPDNKHEPRPDPRDSKQVELSTRSQPAPRIEFGVPPPEQINWCKTGTSNALFYSNDGSRCILPAVGLNKQRYETPVTGECPTSLSVSGKARRVKPCNTFQTMTRDQQCTDVEDPKSCSGEEQPATACDAVVDSATCVCTGSGGITRVRLSCKKMTCKDACTNAYRDFMSSAHSHRRPSKGSDLIKQLAESSVRNTPSDGDDLTKYQSFLTEIEHLETDGAWCGKGIALMAGSVGTMPQAVATVSFIRQYLKSDMPVEIWQSDDEVTDNSSEFEDGLAQLGIVLRTLPPEARSKTTSELFALKPAVVLASSFDVVLLLDADAIPLVDPLLIMQQRAGESAVFWPDYWTLLWDAKIFDAIGGWPFGSAKVAPSQDSGLMVVCKSCGGWKPLALAFYFNYHNDIYYPAIYTGHFKEKACHGKCNNGHTVPGAGDKDTFQLSWMALKLPFRMMPPSALGGTILPKRGLLCGTSFLHKNEQGIILAVHHNSNKWWWKDFATGKWSQSRNSLHLSYQASYVDASTAYRADGINQWKSVTYSGRYDGGKQPPPKGARWCIIYKGDVRISTLEDEIGWDVENTLLQHISTSYVLPWLVDWVSSSAKDSPVQTCLRMRKWMSGDDIDSLDDDTLRNFVISSLNKLGAGTIKSLQGRSDRQLYEICKKKSDEEDITMAVN